MCGTGPWRSLGAVRKVSSLRTTGGYHPDDPNRVKEWGRWAGEKGPGAEATPDRLGSVKHDVGLDVYARSKSMIVGKVSTSGNRRIGFLSCRRCRLVLCDTLS